MSKLKLQPASPLTHIMVRAAKEHNLQSVSLNIPKLQLVCLTGVSGSGKSSLAFDTLYAEGQRRYVESLSSYARQFLGLMRKPEVEHIDGLAPAISIDQKTTSHNPRSTVGTITEVYDYLRLLYARIGHPRCPQCGREVSPQSQDQIVNHIMQLLETEAASGIARIMILSPVVRDKKGAFQGMFDRLRASGYRRVRVDNEYFSLDDDISLLKTNRHTISVVIERVTASLKELRDAERKQHIKRMVTQAVESAVKLAEGFVTITAVHDAGLDFPAQPQAVHDTLFSEKLACSHCGISLNELEPRLFSFNAPQGACPTCNGLGSLLKIAIDKMIAPSLTLSEGAIISFARVLSTDSWWARLVQQVVNELGYDFRKTAWHDMSPEAQDVLLNGSNKIYEVEGENRHGRITTIQETFEGFVKNLERRYRETDSDYIRREIEHFMRKEVCPTCQGARLNEVALAVQVDKLAISQVCALAVLDSLEWVRSLRAKHGPLTLKELTIAESILKEIESRLDFLVSVGVGYLSLDREASTLAGGEAQRIRLASQIGTGLSGVLYILDEPTIGLHPRDNDRLIKTLHSLRDRGNSVLVVEHDREVMLQSDYVFDFGPGAGKNGGRVVAEGTPAEVTANKASLTGAYLGGRKVIRRLHPLAQLAEPRYVDPEAGPGETQPGGTLRIEGARCHNLRGLDVDLPLNKLVCISGVSGSGKSTLLYDVIYANLAKRLHKASDDLPAQVDRLTIPEFVKRAVLIDQRPIGKTPRSNPATYTKSFDIIRELFAQTKDAKLRGYGAGRFSFNTKGGRCETCAGDGQIKIEMQFLPDVYVTCDVCHGKRYNEETLAVEYRGQTIDQILDMTIDEAAQFFTHSALIRILGTLQAVGLGYMQLGQPAPTLSGGEAQRLKLARELSSRSSVHNIYLLDEPTTGLHFADVEKLLQVLEQLVAQNNTVVVIEHNQDIIRNADWVIDLGPEGGDGGGQVVAAGPPDQIKATPQSLTGQHL